MIEKSSGSFFFYLFASEARLFFPPKQKQLSQYNKNITTNKIKSKDIIYFYIYKYCILKNIIYISNNINNPDKIEESFIVLFSKQGSLKNKKAPVLRAGARRG